MSELKAMSFRFQVNQQPPSPAWVDFLIDGKCFTFYASEFLVFVAWLNAEAKKIKTDEQIDREIRRRNR